MAHKQLITPEEVIEQSFIDGDADEGNIKASFIEIAQEEHILPVLGDRLDPDDSLYDEIVAQNDTSPVTLSADNKILLDDFIKPALAFMVKYEILEDLSIRTTAQGLQTNFSEFGRAATDQQRSDLSKTVFRHGQTMIDKMTRFIEDNLDKYPKYKFERNVGNRGNIVGGIIFGPGKFKERFTTPEDRPINDF